jgi:multicomponent Na+:H+ antiporter subunit B
MKKWLKNFMFLALFLILAYNILMMPGDLGLGSPSYNEVTRFYLENSVRDTGAVNIVAAVLADYRAFDTLGETIVLFIAIVAVASILRPTKENDTKEVKHHE